MFVSVDEPRPNHLDARMIFGTWGGVDLGVMRPWVSVSSKKKKGKEKARRAASELCENMQKWSFSHPVYAVLALNPCELWLPRCVYFVVPSLGPSLPSLPG